MVRRLVLQPPGSTSTQVPYPYPVARGDNVWRGLWGNEGTQERHRHGFYGLREGALQLISVHRSWQVLNVDGGQRFYLMRENAMLPS